MNEMNITGQEKLQLALLETETIVFKGYLDAVAHLPVIPLETSLEETLPQVRLQRVTRIVYDKDEDTLGKFNSVFSALHSFNCNVVVILKAVKSHTDIYIGTRKNDGEIGSDADQTLTAAIAGNFPGIQFGERVFDEDIHKLLSPLEGSDMSAIASIAGVPSLKNDDLNSFSQGIEKIIDGMRGREYTAIIQATPVARRELERVENAYADIYSALSVHETQNITFSENDSEAVGKTLTEGITETLSKSVGETITNTTGFGTSESKSQASMDIKGAISKAGASAVSGALSGGVAAGVMSLGLGTLPGAAIGALAGGAAGFAGGLFGGSESASTSTNDSHSQADSSTNSTSVAENSSTTESATTTTGTGKSIQITGKNRRVAGMLESIDAQLERIEECKSYGMWEWGAYFVGSSSIDVKLGADLYSGTLRGETSGLERNNITLWKSFDDSEKFMALQQYVAQLRHPIFEMPEMFQTPSVTHTSLISTREIAVAMSLPRKSLPGIPVYDAAPFGRSVTRLDGAQNDKKTISVGKVSNYGTSDQYLDVDLDVQSLSGHMFVTGSTGAGKSNVIYSVIERLYRNHNIPFLIIEPAKGEYKDVFGGYDGVNVFGTNVKHTPLLRLNPFSFPQNIHVMEHIDRLIEILNAVWPMYAAMPAILKEAIEETYELVGWDLINSICRFEKTVFPDFHDLIGVLPKIINESDYSQEMKGNYAGALVTRVKSMTNGYFKTIFQKDELEPSILFDQACIADLSRVGSTETKSLLMGVLFLKLQEYRMSEAAGSNSELKHVTVIEEAHNLLRRTSGAQSEEGANLQGKSVEMISNAIAEMRTYGEGFIIADQAPGLLDQSAIRNTNTKIILRLPDFDDRNLVGKSARLNEEQIEELASLKTGCAAIYQNNWLEPVLCQFNQFTNELPFTYEASNQLLVDIRVNAKSRFLKSVIKFALTSDGEVLREAKAEYHPYNPKVVEEACDDLNDLPYLVGDTLGLPKILLANAHINQPIEWLKAIRSQVMTQLDQALFDEAEDNALMEQVLELIIRNKPKNRNVLENAFIEVKMMNRESVI
ncbi:MAG: ATP-binding protein [Rhodospirillaceae bacterium]|nr:ATP-binding protein [Colwellia sp.]PCI37339.1 MAG: ATP-binding protein [Rhodospirillaceae bacterium]